MEIVKVALPTSLGISGHIPHFYGEWRSDRHYLAAVEDGLVVGLVCFTWQSARVDNSFGLAYASVSNAWRNKGIAKALMHEFFALAARLNRGIYVTAYEPDGQRYLRKVLLQAAQTHKVPIVEYDYWPKAA
jgi:predicted N-acetyltransferase YhbS